MLVGEEAKTAFLDNLPQMYHEAEYNVIFPNGTRVPATKVQEHMAANPALRPLKMIGDKEVPSRLVLVCEMVVLDPAEWKRVYFRQAFYLSTGTSSSMPNTWLPFDGLIYGGPSDPMASIQYMRKHGVQYGIDNMREPAPGKAYDIHDQIWIDKTEFARDRMDRFTHFYEEPDLMRLGPLSHAIMSYCLGGGTWERSGASETIKRSLVWSGIGGANPMLPTLLESLRPPRPMVPLFAEMIGSPDIPIAPVAVVNDYILGNRATSYMNAFLGLDGDVDFTRIPGLYVDVMQGEKRFRLILHAVMANLRIVLREIVMEVQRGTISPTKAHVEEVILRRLPEIVSVGIYPGWNLLDHIGQLRFHLRVDREVTGGRRKTRRFKMPRKYSRKYCKKTPCKRMGFTQRSSCRPYKNCF